MLKKITLQVLLQLYFWSAEMVLWLFKRKTKPLISEQPNIYYSITGLPFNCFLDFYINGDYSALLRYGNADVLNLVDAGEKIKADFFEHTASADAISNFKDYVKLKRIESKIERIKSIADSLSQRYNKELAELLQGLGVITIPQEATAEKDIKQVLKECKRFEIEAETIRIHLNGKGHKETKPKREDFEAILAEVDPSLMPEQIDTLRFTILYKKLLNRNKHNGAGKDK